MKENEAKNVLKIGKYEIEKKRIPFLILHLFIVIAFVIEIVYCIITFGVVAGTGSGAAGLEAAKIPLEEMVTRRLYAIELWISSSGLAVYLAVVYRNKLANLFTKTK